MMSNIFIFIIICLIFYKLFIIFFQKRKRYLINIIMQYIIYCTFLIALIPLASVMYMTLVNGMPGISFNFLSHSMNGVTGIYDKMSVESNTPVLGGIYHALIGTMLITLFATIISIPIGLLTSIYIVEYSQNNILGKVITFFVDIMTGIPSIVAGLFAYTFFSILIGPGTKNGMVGTISLSILMIPMIVKSSEEMLKIVPIELREASYALGVPKWRTILSIILPTAISGIISGITISIARVVGETAPLIVTAGFSLRMNYNPFNGWMTSLPAYIYQQAFNPTAPQAPGPSMQRAWSGALVLIFIVMLLNLIANLISKYFAPKNRK